MNSHQRRAQARLWRGARWRLRRRGYSVPPRSSPGAWLFLEDALALGAVAHPGTPTGPVPVVDPRVVASLAESACARGVRRAPRGGSADVGGSG